MFVFLMSKGNGYDTIFVMVLSMFSQGDIMDFHLNIMTNFIILVRYGQIFLWNVVVSNRKENIEV